MTARFLECLIVGLVLGACSKRAAVTADAEPTGAAARDAVAGLVLHKASPVEGLVGEWKSGDGKISFDVHRRDPSDPFIARNPDAARSAQARIRDSRGLAIWGGPGLERPTPDEAVRTPVKVTPPPVADLELVKKLPDVLRQSGIDTRALEPELKALDGASAAFRGVDGPGGPAPRPPTLAPKPAE